MDVSEYMSLLPNFNYFHPHLSTKDQIKCALLPYIEVDGSFLVRKSLTSQDMLTVSVIHQQSIKHIKIEGSPGQFHLEDIYFDSIPKLISYYANYDVPNLEGFKGVRLLHPIEYRPYSMNQNSLEVQCTQQPFISTGVASRPPISLPKCTGLNGIYNGEYYSHVKEENKLPELLHVLKLESQTDDVRCECGLDTELSELPQGWTVHVNRERNPMYGRPFFTSPSSVTSWTLPEEVESEMDYKQKKLVWLLRDNFKEVNAPPDEEKLMHWKLLLTESTADGEPFESKCSDDEAPNIHSVSEQDTQQQTK